LIDKEVLQKYLVGPVVSNFPVLVGTDSESAAPGMFEREIIYKFLGDLKREVSELKKIVTDLKSDKIQSSSRQTLELSDFSTPTKNQNYAIQEDELIEDIHIGDHVVIDDQYSLIDAEKDLIKKALEKHNNKRKLAADELGISERTLYRKIREYGIV